MTDEDFLALGVEEARVAWLEAATPKERERLHHIYSERHSVKLSSGAATLGGSGKNDSSGVTLDALGWLLLVAGIGAGVAGALADYPIIWLIVLGSAGANAGFFCILFGYIGKKLDLVAERLKQ